MGVVIVDATKKQINFKDIIADETQKTLDEKQKSVILSVNIFHSIKLIKIKLNIKINLLFDYICIFFILF